MKRIKQIHELSEIFSNDMTLFGFFGNSEDYETNSDDYETIGN